MINETPHDNVSVHGNDLYGERGEITSPLFPHMYDIESGSEEVGAGLWKCRKAFKLQYCSLQVITWRVTVDDAMSVMLTFTVFEIESSHYPNDETCNSKIQANH